MVKRTSSFFYLLFITKKENFKHFIIDLEYIKIVIENSTGF